MSDRTIYRELDDHLVLRNATPDDAEALSQFNGEIHAAPDADEPEQFVVDWTRDLMTRPHPTLKPDDFLVVVDTQADKIVSSLNYIPQTWSYAGIPFEVGRPELVGTHPEYRRRGLVRQQFEVIHQWGEALGHQLQAITGIPFYYRQFGYEMCVNLGGSRIGYAPHVPKLKADETESYHFRPLVEADLPFVMEVYQHGVQRNLLACVRTENIWQYDIFGKSPETRAVWLVIENQAQEPVGFLLHNQKLRGPNMQVWGYELKAGASYLDVTPALIRYLDQTGRKLAAADEKVEYAGYEFGLGSEHPVYEVLPGRMPRIGKPYAWYMRIPHLADFITHIGPALEQRLAQSPAAGHTGDLKLSFFRSGIQLSFENGHLKNVADYWPENIDDGDFMFPDQTFLRVLLGHTASEDLKDMFADCYPRNDQGRALVKFLFPKQASDIWMLG